MGVYKYNNCSIKDSPNNTNMLKTKMVQSCMGCGFQSAACNTCVKISLSIDWVEHSCAYKWYQIPPQTALGYPRQVSICLSGEGMRKACGPNCACMRKTSGKMRHILRLNDIIEYKKGARMEYTDIRNTALCFISTGDARAICYNQQIWYQVPMLP